MKRLPPNRRRPSVHITLGRAARLHRLIAILAQGSQRREELLGKLQIGLRTFYRELELLKRCGIKIKLKYKNYELQSTAEEAEGRLPFPDPQLSFAEMAELARGTGPASQRLAAMLEAVISQSTAPAKPKRKRRSGRSRGQAGAG